MSLHVLDTSVACVLPPVAAFHNTFSGLASVNGHSHHVLLLSVYVKTLNVHEHPNEQLPIALTQHSFNEDEVCMYSMPLGRRIKVANARCRKLVWHVASLAAPAAVISSSSFGGCPAGLVCACSRAASKTHANVSVACSVLEHPLENATVDTIQLLSHITAHLRGTLQDTV